MEKQIEEMAKVILNADCAKIPCECCAYDVYDGDLCMHMFEATALYNAGYRKASQMEREREIFDKIENNIKYNISLIEAMMFESEKIRKAKLQCYRDFLGYLAGLKKEYIGEDINDRTNTEGEG